MRASAVVAVVRRWVAGNGEITWAEPAATARLMSGGARQPSMARARTMMTGAVPRSKMRRTSRSIEVWKPPIIRVLVGPLLLAQSCARRIMSPGHDCEQKKPSGATVWQDSDAPRRRGLIGIVLVCTHAEFNVVIDYEIELFVTEPEMRSQQPVDIVDKRFRALNLK